MKNKIAHFIVALVGFCISMIAITYMIYGRTDWFFSISFAIVMGIADVFWFEKLRKRKK